MVQFVSSAHALFFDFLKLLPLSSEQGLRATNYILDSLFRPLESLCQNSAKSRPSLEESPQHSSSRVINQLQTAHGGLTAELADTIGFVCPSRVFARGKQRHFFTLPRSTTVRGSGHIVLIYDNKKQDNKCWHTSFFPGMIKLVLFTRPTRSLRTVRCFPRASQRGTQERSFCLHSRRHRRSQIILGLFAPRSFIEHFGTTINHANSGARLVSIMRNPFLAPQRWYAKINYGWYCVVNTTTMEDSFFRPTPNLHLMPLKFPARNTQISMLSSK